uniref:EGF-like domain-containing protein n=1 Tax=Parascaris equorum TaxID=6256 RepID=A0A914S3R0_PAREQ
MYGKHVEKQLIAIATRIVLYVKIPSNIIANVYRASKAMGLTYAKVPLCLNSNDEPVVILVVDECAPTEAHGCHEHAECVYGQVEGAYICKCVQVGDGYVNCEIQGILFCTSYQALAVSRNEPFHRSTDVPVGG